MKYRDDAGAAESDSGRAPVHRMTGMDESTHRNTREIHDPKKGVWAGFDRKSKAN